MEEDIQQSHISSSSTIKRIDERLKAAIALASEKLDRESAHDKDLLRALSIVHSFIERKKRVCYGGTAMNAILPPNRRFYNPDVDLPDYDFYTPDVDSDVKELIADLVKEGFTDVYQKVGIHDGTKKVLVNFIAVADISYIEPELFAVMYRRSILRGGIHYTDPDVLRMMMYLELSRPRGMVSRWEKVFERLQLINQEFPILAGCRKYATRRQRHETTVSYDMRKTILDYAIHHKRILCNDSLMNLYKRGIRHKNAVYRIRGGGPLLFTSPDPKEDCKALQVLLKKDTIHIFKHPERGELVPLRIELRIGDTPICMFIEETACHSYNPVSLPDRRVIYIASPEFLITLYLSIYIFTNRSGDYLGERVPCQVKELIRLSILNYGKKGSQFPAFSLECQGHQVSYTSLLKAKVKRVKKELQPKTRTKKRASTKSKTMKKKVSSSQ
jgi:hypothetical protein